MNSTLSKNEFMEKFNNLSEEEQKGLIQEWIKEEAEKNAPRKGEKEFTSVGDVNRWLVENPRVVPTSFKLSTASTFGLFANHSQARNIKVEYVEHEKPSGYEYGMSEEETTNLFTATNSDEAKEAWKRRHPDLEPILMSVTSNSRGSAGSVAFGMGLDLIEHNKVFCIFRKKKEEETELVQSESKECPKSNTETEEKANRFTDKDWDVDKFVNDNKGKIAKGYIVFIAVIVLILIIVILKAVGSNDRFHGFESSKPSTPTVIANMDNSTEGNKVEQEENSIPEDVMRDKEDSAVCMGGLVSVSIVDYDKESNIIVISITNNTDKDISTFGFPVQIINGETIELDVFKNMESGMVDIAPGTFAKVAYTVDERFFDGGILRGELHTMSPTKDRTYEVKFVGE